MPHVRITGKIDYDFAAASRSLSSETSMARSGVGTLHCLIWISVRPMPVHVSFYSRWFGAPGYMFDSLLRCFLIIVRTIHGLIEPTELASLQIPNEDCNQDSKEAVEEVQHTKDQGKFVLGRVGRVCAG